MKKLYLSVVLLALVVLSFPGVLAKPADFVSEDTDFEGKVNYGKMTFFFFSGLEIGESYKVTFKNDLFWVYDLHFSPFVVEDDKTFRMKEEVRSGIHQGHFVLEELSTGTVVAQTETVRIQVR